MLTLRFLSCMTPGFVLVHYQSQLCVCVCLCVRERVRRFGFEFSGVVLISGSVLLCPAFTMVSEVPGAKIRQKRDRKCSAGIARSSLTQILVLFQLYCNHCFTSFFSNEPIKVHSHYYQAGFAYTKSRTFFFHGP